MKLRSILILALLLVAAVCASAVEPFAFIHITDTHISDTGWNTQRVKPIVDEVNAMNPKPAFVLVTGDLTDLGSLQALENAKKAYAEFSMPVYCVSGNHEVKWSNMGKVGIERTFGRGSYYSFDYGGIHFVGLDSTIWLQGDGFFDRPQLEWLKSDLQKVGKEEPIVVFYHHWPRSPINQNDLMQVLKPYNARLALTGHYHMYNNMTQNGFVVLESQNTNTGNSGYRIMEVTPTEIKSYIKPVGKDKTLDKVVPFSSSGNRVTILKPTADQHLNGQVHIRASVIPGSAPYRKVEVGIDNDYIPVTPDKDGIVDITRDWVGDPGWWRVTVRANEADGVDWYDQVMVHIASKPGQPDEVWRVRTAGPVQRRITVSGDRLYFGNWAGEVYCLDAATGGQIWKRELGSDVICEVAVEKGRAYLGTADGRILAMDAATGSTKWEYKTDGPIQSSPTIAGGMVFIGSGDEYLYALDARTGKLCWKNGPHRLIECMPLYMNAVVCFGAWDNYVYALAAKDGSERWKTPIGPNIWFSAGTPYPASDGRRIVVGCIPTKDDPRDILCLDAETGKTVWKLKNPSGQSSCAFHGATVVGDRFFITTADGGVFCMSMADGKEIWCSSSEHALNDCRPTIRDGKLYVTGLWGGVFGFDAATGKKEWDYSTGNAYILGQSSIWKDLVIVPTMDGSVLAIRR